MSNRYPLLFIPALLLLATVVTPSDAARRPAVKGTPSGPIEAIQVAPNAPAMPAPGCRLGPTEIHFTMNYIFPPNDEYYTLIDPASCGCNSPAGVMVTTAHAFLDFPEPCKIPVTVAVVAAEPDEQGCARPVRDEILCPPVDYDLEVSNAGGYDFLMPLGGTVCITEKAFLLITFREVGDCGNVPSLYVTFGCDPCTSWNYWPDGALTDLCDGYLLGNPVMYVDAACCDVVPAMPQSWGRLKSTYR
jgi:hypothetical protein